MTRLTAMNDSRWTSVVIDPPIRVRTGEVYNSMVSANGKVMVVVGPETVQVFLRTADEDHFVLAVEHPLTSPTDKDIADEEQH